VAFIHRFAGGLSCASGTQNCCGASPD